MMQILLDTHIFIWWTKDDDQLSRAARELIEKADVVYVSSVSIWEVAIKIQIGKLEGDINEIIDAIEQEGFTELSLSARQAALISELQPIHKDPFDRMLIAQAISEPLRFVTSDLALRGYSDLVHIV